MRIAESEFALLCLRYEAVNSPSVIFGRFSGNTLLEFWQRAADTECRIEAKGQPCGQRRAQSPAAWLRLGSQHLQFDARQSRLRIYLRVYGFKIVAATYDNLVRQPTLASRIQLWRVDPV